MELTTQVDSDRTVITLAGDLTFDTVAAVLKEVKKADGTLDLELRFDSLGELDLAGLQCLYAIQFDRAEAGKTLLLSGDDAIGRLERMAEFAGLPQLRQD